MWNQIFGVGELDGAAFTRLVAKEGVKRGVLAAPQVDAAAMVIRNGATVFNLKKVHREFLNLPRRDRLAYVRDHVLEVFAPIDESTSSWESMRPHLRPVIRHASYLVHANLATRLQGHEVKPLATQIAPDLYVTLVIDEPTRMLVPTTELLEAWKVSFEEAYIVAVGNLAKTGLGVTPFGEGLWMLPSLDDYTTSWILVKSLLRKLCPNALVAVPAYDAMVIADPSVATARDTLLTLMLPSEDGKNPITHQIYQLEGDDLVRWTPTSHNEHLLDAYKRGLLLEQGRHYAVEHRMRLELETDDGYYAQQMVLETPTGVFVTRTTWTHGIVSYLPPAEAIVFMMHPNTPAQRAWEVEWNTVATAGFLTRIDSPLARWRTSEFPPIAWLEKHATRQN